MDQGTGLMWTLVAVIAVLMVVLFTVAIKLRTIQRELKILDSSIDKLGQRLADQEARLREIKAALDTSPSDPFGPILGLLSGVRSKGLVPTVTLLASHLFRTYLARRRTKALPHKQVSER